MIKDTDRTLQLLENVSQGLASINADEQFEDIADQILTIFRRSDVREIDILILRDITHILCGKLMFISEANFKTNARKLYHFLKEQKLVSGVFEKFIDEKLSQLDESQETSRRKSEAQAISCDPLMSSKQVTASLKQLLNINAKSSNIDKHLGFALLDLEGNFLLLCKKSRHFFGLKNSECKIFNFFSLIIPFSKQVLAKKFGSEMFQEDKLGSNTRNFNYVIYSKTALKKFYTIMKNKKIETKEEFDQKLETLESSANGRDLYNAYLTALSSSATMITMRYSESDIVKWNDEKLLFKKNLKFMESNLVSLESLHKINAGQAFDLPANQQQGSLDFRSININGNHAESDENTQKQSESPKELIYTKRLILLKTRYSKTVPMFRYQDLKDQGMILNFKQYLRDKIFSCDEKDGTKFDLLSDS